MAKRVRCSRWFACAGVASLVAVGTLVPTAVAAGAAKGKSPIVIGMVADETGVAASTFADGPGGAQARIDLQNAQGGVDGHPLELVTADDESNPNDVVTDAEDLVENKGATGLITDSTFSYAAAAFTQAHDVPAVSPCPCGPQFSEKPYSNMFGWSGGGGSPTIFNGLEYTTTIDAQFLKDVGVTKLAALGYGISAASVDSLKLLYGAAQNIGGFTSSCFTDYSVPFGGVDFTADVLSIKSAGCNGVAGSFVDASDVSLAEAVKNGGVNAKQLYFTGYDNDVLKSAGARRAFDGVYLSASINFSTPNQPTKVMLNALKKYDHFSGIPDLGLYGSYLSANLLIQGLELAGPNATGAEIVKDLRNVSNYTAGGILPSPVSFQHFGTPAMLPKRTCAYVMQLQGSHFVVYKNKPICGKTIGVPGIA